MLTRRGFFGGLLAAPAIIRPGLLMPVKPLLSIVVTRTYFELPLGAAWQAEWLGKAVEIRFSDDYRGGDALERLRVIEARMVADLAKITEACKA